LTQTTQQLESLLVDLAKIASDEGMRTLASELVDDRLPALREGRVTVVVLGEFNHGKTTILNALLGGEVLPMGITPTTAVITHLRHAQTPGVTIHHDDGKTTEAKLEDLPRLVGADQTAEPRFVEVRYPAEILDGNLVLVDTPGVNDISRQRVEITYGYVPRADVVVYVLDAGQVLKRSEIAFIRDRLLRDNRNRILFVLGKVDALDDDERAEVETYAREKLAELIGPVELYPLSAKRALAGGDPGFDAFRQRLSGFLDERKAYILLDSGVSGGLRVAGMLRQNLAIKRRSYELDQDELQRRVDAVRVRLRTARKAIYENLDRIDETVSGLKMTARHNLREFTTDFAESLPREVDRASVAEIKKYLPDWISDTYRAWLEKEGTALARELERLAEEVIETTNANMAEAVEDVQDELGLERGALRLEIDTLTYDVGVYALGTLGVSIALLSSVLVGGLVLLATPLLALFVKDRVDKRVKALAKEEGDRAIREAGARVEEEMVQVIDDYGSRLKAFVEAAGDRLYQQIDEVLHQVITEVADANVDRGALDTDAAAAEARVAKISAELVALRTELTE
jgi:small GTP-binding protein